MAGVTVTKRGVAVGGSEKVASSQLPASAVNAASAGQGAIPVATGSSGYAWAAGATAKDAGGNAVIDTSVPLKFARSTYGTADQAVVQSRIANRPAATTQVMGSTDLSSITERGSVTDYVENSLTLPTVDSTLTTFSASSVVFDVSVSLTSVKPGMVVDTGGVTGVGNPASGVCGVVASVTGQTVNLTAAGWRQSSASAATPANGTRCQINFTNAAWAANFAVYKNASGDARISNSVAIGLELDVFTDVDDATGARVDYVGGSYGYTAVAGGTGKPRTAYVSRGTFGYGFVALDTFGQSFASAQTGDTNPRWAVDKTGKMQFGPGGGTALDTDLYRANGALKTDNSMSIAGAQSPASGQSLELVFSAGAASVQAYDRSGSAYLPLALHGSSTSLYAAGTARLTVDGTGVGFFGAASAAQPALGAATAAATYGTNEQSMLQKAYNALRTLGLAS